MAGTFTKLYLTGQDAPYTPATIRGAWDDTGGAVTKALSPYKLDKGDNSTTISRAETSALADWDVLLYRGVSGPLAAQTINCNVNLMVGVCNYGSSGTYIYHVHLFATVGDSDTVRCTLLNDYIDTGNPWPYWSFVYGQDFAAAQAVNQSVQEGDRLVIEIGFRTNETTTTSKTGKLGYGTTGLVDLTTPDLTHGEDARLFSGFIEFSSAISSPDSETISAAQFSVRALNLSPDPAAQVAQFSVRSLSLNGNATAYVANFFVRTLSQCNPPPTEYAPEGSFGALYWYEFDSPDGTVQVHAPVALPDPSTYYHGYKQPKLIGGIRVSRALSDEKGQFTSQRFSVTSDDSDRYYRTLVHGQDTVLLDRKVTARLISIDEWRARGIPRTVAIGLVRNYTTK